MHPSHQPLFYPEYGAVAPLFHAPCGTNPRYAFGSTAGRYVLMAFCGAHDHPAAHSAIEKIKSAKCFDDKHASAFGVWLDGKTGKLPLSTAQIPGLRHFDDPDGKIFELYRSGTRAEDGKSMKAFPCLLALDPMLRVMARAPLESADEMIALIANQPVPNAHAGVQVDAPILVLPRVFEESFCDELIAYYKSKGAEYSGVMAEKNGKTVYVENPSFKVRFDCQIDDEDLRTQAREKIRRRLVPMLYRALNFKATRMERYIVASYTHDKGGFFLPHRDNTTKGTAHRAFAVTINLNTGDYEGGGLRFPEFSDRVYVAPRGGAVVFGCSLLHEAMPVKAGYRYAFLPFLYDDTGAKIREENSAFLDESVPNYAAST